MTFFEKKNPIVPTAYYICAVTMNKLILPNRKSRCLEFEFENIHNFKLLNANMGSPYQTNIVSTGEQAKIIEI